MRFRNPAIEQFIRFAGREVLFVQVLIRACEDGGFDLRHHEDRQASAETLRLVPCDAARSIAMNTVEGIFRPLKCAPSMIRGWRVFCKSDEELEAVLNSLYPGTMADWFAVQNGSATAADFRNVAERQTGMFRTLSDLSDTEVEEVTRKICAPENCLKQRLWKAALLPTDGLETKSLAPCLEPCALLLDCARKMAKRPE